MYKVSDVRRAAMDLLARREHSVKELHEKLLLRFSKNEKPRYEKPRYEKPRYEKHNSPKQELEQLSGHETDEATVGSSLPTFEPSTFESSTAEPPEPSLGESRQLEGIILEQVERLKNEGLQSDARMAEAYIRARSNRGHGPQKIAMELRQKGITESLLESSLAESGIDWLIKIKLVAAKKYGEPALDTHTDKTTEMKAKAKRNRFLLQRGFSYELIALLDA